MTACLEQLVLYQAWQYPKGRFSLADFENSAGFRWIVQMKSDTTVSKMATLHCRVTHIQVGQWGYWQNANFGHCGQLNHYLRTCGQAGIKHGFDSFQFEEGFGLVENVHEISIEVVNNRTDATPFTMSFIMFRRICFGYSIFLNTAITNEEFGIYSYYLGT